MIREARAEDALAIGRIHVDAWKKTYHNIIPSNYLKKICYKQVTQQ